MKLKRSFILFLNFAFLVLNFAYLCGCDAFVRKFTRKPKKEYMEQEEMVLVPQEYKGPQMTKEELYRQYLLFWKSWQDELIEALLRSNNHKKQLSCAQEAIKNLEQLTPLLKEEKQKALEIYINQMRDLKGSIEMDTYSMNTSPNRMSAERIRRYILRDFSYNKMKDFIL